MTKGELFKMLEGLDDNAHITVSGIDDTYDVLDQAGYKVHYNFFQNVWVNEKDEIDKHVIAWCEIPTFDKE